MTDEYPKNHSLVSAAQLRLDSLRNEVGMGSPKLAFSVTISHRSRRDMG